MTESRKWTRKLAINALLFTVLVGLLVTHLTVIGDLPSRIYTVAQQDYLSYNLSRDVSQAAPTYNLVLPSGELAPTLLPVEQNEVQATLTARYEEHEGVSVTTYDLEFRGEYRLSYSGPAPTSTVKLFFPFPANLETLHEVQFLVDGRPHEAGFSARGIGWQTVLNKDDEHLVAISYQADGAQSFTYGLQRDQRSDVNVTIEVVGLTGTEVPRSSLPSTFSSPIQGGEAFTWDYTGLIPTRDIEITLPARLSFAQRVARLQDDLRTLALCAPLFVGLFLASLAAMFQTGKVRLPLHSYLLLGLGLALFYPLLTFLSGLMHVLLAATLALLLISGLCLIFLGLTAGWRRTWWRGGLPLIVFLGFFSLGMLTPWRGLLLTLGSLILVSTFMVLYARRPLPPEPEPKQASPSTAQPAEESEPKERHCPRCGRPLESDHSFCPTCSYDIRRLRRCANCDHEQFVPTETEAAHCIHCGHPFG